MVNEVANIFNVGLVQVLLCKALHLLNILW